MTKRMWPGFAAVAAGALVLAAGIRDSWPDRRAGRSAPGPEVAALVPGRSPTDTVRVKLAVRGMTCGGCATTARIALERVEGVHRAEVSYDSASAVVLYDAEKTSPERFIGRLREMTGYEARVVEEPQPPGRRRRVRAAFVGRYRARLT